MVPLALYKLHERFSPLCMANERKLARELQRDGRSSRQSPSKASGFLCCDSGGVHCHRRRNPGSRRGRLKARSFPENEVLESPIFDLTALSSASFAISVSLFMYSSCRNMSAQKCSLGDNRAGLPVSVHKELTEPYEVESLKH